MYDDLRLTLPIDAELEYLHSLLSKELSTRIFCTYNRYLQRYNFCLLDHGGDYVSSCSIPREEVVMCIRNGTLARVLSGKPSINPDVVDEMRDVEKYSVAQSSDFDDSTTVELEEFFNSIKVV